MLVVLHVIGIAKHLPGQTKRGVVFIRLVHWSDQQCQMRVGGPRKIHFRQFPSGTSGRQTRRRLAADETLLDRTMLDFRSDLQCDLSGSGTQRWCQRQRHLGRIQRSARELSVLLSQYHMGTIQDRGDWKLVPLRWT